MHESPGEVLLPTPCVVMLIGASGSGKTSFAHRHFGRYEVLSSDQCRAMISDDEADQSVTAEAFDLLRSILRMRLAAGRISVVDATNVQPHARARTLEVARAFDVPTVAIVLATGPEVCIARNAGRGERPVPEASVRRQFEDLTASLPMLASEGYADVQVLEENLELVTFRRL